MKTGLSSKDQIVGPNEGVVDWLLACPQKGFFVPFESESTDVVTLSGRRQYPQ
jgi:hypothetical protein